MPSRCNFLDETGVAARQPYQTAGFPTPDIPKGCARSAFSSDLGGGGGIYWASREKSLKKELREFRPVNAGPFRAGGKLKACNRRAIQGKEFDKTMTRRRR
jgi:hypothetical protein